MSAATRPGGLTALAVVNFAASAMYALTALSYTMLLLMPFPPPGQAGSDMPEDQRKMIEALRAWEGSWPYVFLSIALTAVLLLSGIGYLRQKKLMGRWLGNAYVVLGLAIVALETMGPEGFTFMAVVAVVYPLLTLLLVNTTFKDDLTQ